jgi:prepilin signal peptidase PulO-like enzyme (type II secretory pathway)
MNVILGALLLATGSAVGIGLSKVVTAGTVAHPDGPARGSVPPLLLIVACATLGGTAGSRGVSISALEIIALVCGLLSAIWVADVTVGIIPDVFTLVPLGAVFVASMMIGHWEMLIASLVPAIPFAALAWRSHGKGLGWGDVKLAALGGPLIGMQAALLSFALGSLIAVLVCRISGKKGQPVAFGPYLAAAIAVPLALLTPAR